MTGSPFHLHLKTIIFVKLILLLIGYWNLNNSPDEVDPFYAQPKNLILFLLPLLDRKLM